MLQKRFRTAWIAFFTMVFALASCTNPAGGSSPNDETKGDDGGSGGQSPIAMGSAALDVTGDESLSLSGETIWANGANVNANNDRWFVTVTDPSGATVEITIYRGRDPGDPFAAVPDDDTFELSNGPAAVTMPGAQAMSILIEKPDGTQYYSPSFGTTGSAVLTKDASLNEWSITIDAESLEEVGAAGTPRTVDLNGAVTAVPESGFIVADVDGLNIEGLLVTGTNLVGGALDVKLENSDLEIELSLGYDSSAPFEYQTGTFQLSDPLVETLFVRVDPGGTPVTLGGNAIVQISAANETQGRISGELLLYGFDPDDDIGMGTGDGTFTLNVTFTGVLIE
ncbi:MAG TPA: hypothetical protein VKA06_11570 [Spirochaetia bacterium]|nr:hypothetical protein [Spirochaetia bacterium]